MPVFPTFDVNKFGNSLDVSDPELAPWLQLFECLFEVEREIIRVKESSAFLCTQSLSLYPRPNFWGYK